MASSTFFFFEKQQLYTIYSNHNSLPPTHPKSFPYSHMPNSTPLLSFLGGQQTITTNKNFLKVRRNIHTQTKPMKHKFRKHNIQGKVQQDKNFQTKQYKTKGLQNHQ